MKNVGLIGGGALACAIGERLLESGFPLTAINRTPQKLKILAERGAEIMTSLSDLCRSANVVIACLTDADAVRDYLLSTHGKGALAGTGVTLLNVGTVGADNSRQLEEEFATIGVTYIDMPVSGGPKGARNGSLAAYVGRPIDHCQPFAALIAALCENVIYLPHNWVAQQLKVLNNLCEAINLWGAAEAVNAARDLGIDIQTIARGLTIGRGDSVYLRVLLDSMTNRSDEVAVSHAIRIKDLQLAVDMAAAEGSALPLGQHVLRLFQSSASCIGSNMDQTRCEEYVATLGAGL